MKGSTSIILFVMFLAVCSYSVNDTLVLQQGLDGYTGVEGTYIEDGWFVTQNANYDKEPRLHIGKP